MQRFIFGDVETSGLGADSGVVEISWIETDAEFNEVARHHSLINPGVPIQYGAMAVHGITEEAVADKPSIEDFMAAAGNPLAGPGTVLVAHNAPFDIRYFGPWMAEPNTLCTLRCARILYPDADNHKLGTLRFMLGLEGDHERAHSADEDVAVLIQLAKRMCQDAGCTLPDLLEVQKRKRLIKVIGFGKHKGTALKDLPSAYVHWLLNKAENLDEDLRASLMSI